MTNRTTRSLAVLLLALGGGLTPALAQQPGSSVRIGFFPNVSHAPALVAYEQGFYTANLPGVKVEIKEFVSGTTLSEAFAAGALDIGLIGPGPLINAAARGMPVQIIAGASQAGTVLIARAGSGITSLQDLRGKRVAVPALGNSQDILLRSMLREQNLKAESDGGDITVLSVPPSDLAASFAGKQIDAAIVPEPWGALLESQGNTLIGDEKSVWQGGAYPAALVIVNTKFASSNPQIVKGFLRAHLQAIRLINTAPDEAQAAIAVSLQKLADQTLDPQVLATALRRTPISADVNLETLRAFGQLSVQAGYTRKLPDFETLLNLSYLNEVVAGMVGK